MLGPEQLPFCTRDLAGQNLPILPHTLCPGLGGGGGGGGGGESIINPWI